MGYASCQPLIGPCPLHSLYLLNMTLRVNGMPRRASRGRFSDIHPVSLWRYATVLLRFLYALRLEGRSFVGSMKELLSKTHCGVDLGLALERLPCGCLVQNERTNARHQSIRALVSLRPWASTIDREIFLEGFDAGEQYALDRSSKSIHTHLASASTFQEKSADSGHTSVVIPAAIAAATRKLERTRQKL